MTIEEAGRRALKMVAPLLFICAGPFFIIHGWEPIKTVSLLGIGLFFLITLVAIIIHELIHALLFGLLSRDGFRSIRFGIDRKTLSPYCHPTGYMKVWDYRIGALAPMAVLGILPTIISFWNGNFAYMVFGFLFTIAAGGDIISVWLTRHLSGGDIIKDHSSKLGFYIISTAKKI
jgi:hypothetical protein